MKLLPRCTVTNTVTGVLVGLLAAYACGVTPPTPVPSPVPTPTPTPIATPTPQAQACPALERWGSKLFHCVDANFQTVTWDDGDPRPIAGGVCTGDTTPQFQGPNGSRCNVEHDTCGAARCEDPRGPVFHSVVKPAGVSANVDGYQIHFGNGCKDCRLKPGEYRFCVSPRDPMLGQDGQNVPLPPGGGGTCTRFEVPE
jgi:hypothetical protein